MKKVIFMSGLPASGKTTKAIALISKGFKRVNKDNLRLMTDNSMYSAENEKIIKKLYKSIILTLLYNEKNIVLDNTNLRKKDYQEIHDICECVGDVELEHIHFDTDVETCIERDFARTGNEYVGPKRIREFAELLNDFTVMKKKIFDKKIKST